ncbi:hypothetical protein M011DRAFT_476038 [Sporormia fimetaria CBS 119925]|uniref:RING-type domain-containing protein n=1 Tax=Sporormia fimetaria CBS 119925 TaxID=1340428 RepID=A0A6A6VHG7_9PLEO|nr:hypothetical protein M011DRAFT_476038 [Sporormia fimetaria CBS 119925]
MADNNSPFRNRAAFLDYLRTVNVPPGTECDICVTTLGRYEVAVQLPCSHIFGCDCVEEWTQISPTCPMCRAVLYREENPARQNAILGRTARWRELDLLDIDAWIEEGSIIREEMGDNRRQAARIRDELEGMDVEYGRGFGLERQLRTLDVAFATLERHLHYVSAWSRQFGEDIEPYEGLNNYEDILRTDDGNADSAEHDGVHSAEDDGTSEDGLQSAGQSGVLSSDSSLREIDYAMHSNAQDDEDDDWVLTGALRELFGYTED